MESVYSMFWDDQKGNPAELMDPVHQQKVQQCRDALLPRLNELRKVQDGAMDLLGIDREEMEFELMAVDSLDQRMEKKMQEAKQSGDFFDLCESDDEPDVQPQPSSRMKQELLKVKAEPRTKAAPSAITSI